MTPSPRRSHFRYRSIVVYDRFQYVTVCGADVAEHGGEQVDLGRVSSPLFARVSRFLFLMRTMLDENFETRTVCPRLLAVCSESRQADVAAVQCESLQQSVTHMH
eukprot:765730-Hanusia_phi.AAC.4